MLTGILILSLINGNFNPAKQPASECRPSTITNVCSHRLACYQINLPVTLSLQFPISSCEPQATILPPSSPPAHLSFFPSTRRALPMDSFSPTVTLRAASHVHPVTARKHPKRVQKFQPRSAIPVISRSMPLLNKLLNSIPIRTTTIWSALIVPNATAVTSKA